MESIRMASRVLNGKSGLAHLDALYARYQAVHIARDMAETLAVFFKLMPANAGTDSNIFHERRQRWERKGGFIEQVPRESFREWILSDSSVVMEWIEPGDSTVSPGQGVAQCICFCPDTALSKPLVEPLREDRDTILDWDLYHQMQNLSPSQIGLLDFWCVSPEHSGCGYAVQVKEDGLGVIRERNQGRPPESQIRVLIGKVFSICGLRSPDGREYLLSVPEQEIRNEISLRSNQEALQTPAVLLGKSNLKEAIEVRLEAKDEQYALLVNWYYLVYHIHSSD